jgi:UDP-GlcNAc:undecaprenyl-phosphate GlcNAc-1-phosphate transferase
LLAAVSYVDDVRAGPFVVKLAAQVAATLAVIVAGDQINKVYISGQLINLPALLGPPLTFAVFLFVTNAVNFADGLNGLAGGSVGVAGLALAAGAPPGLAGAAPGAALGEQAMPLVAGIAGFLPFNYPRARIFMGDVGSQLCGFVAADLAVCAAGSPASLIVPLALMPMLADVAFTLVRRMLTGERLTEAHRGHLYQIANRSGVAAAQVTAAYWGMAAWGGAWGVLAGRHGGGVAAGIAWVIIALAPMVGWLAYVVRAAKRAGITRW